MKGIWYQPEYEYLMIAWPMYPSLLINRFWVFDSGDGERITELPPSDWGWEFIDLYD